MRNLRILCARFDNGCWNFTGLGSQIYDRIASVQNGMEDVEVLVDRFSSVWLALTRIYEYSSQAIFDKNKNDISELGESMKHRDSINKYSNASAYGRNRADEFSFDVSSVFVYL